MTKISQVITVISKITCPKLKVVLSGCLLLFIPLSVLIHNGFDSNANYYFPFLEDGEMYWNISLNPIIHGHKNLQFVVSLGCDRICAIIYIICAAIRPDFGKFLKVNLWWFYLSFEVCRLIDHFLTYEQTPFRQYFGYLLIIYTVLYAVLFVTKND